MNIGWKKCTFASGEANVTAVHWYPAGQGGVVKSYPTGEKHAVYDAAQLDPKAPLVLLIHGTGGNSFTHSYLAEFFVRRGMQVLAPEMPKFSDEASRWMQLWQFPFYSSLAVKGLLAQQDLDSVALVVGHSVGAYTTLMLAQAQADFRQLAELRPYHQQIQEMLWMLKPTITVEKLLLLDPALSDVFSPQGLSEVTIPGAMFYSGIHEVNMRGKPQAYETMLPQLQMSHCFRDAGHYVYNNQCSPIMSKIAPYCCVDQKVNRAEIHKHIMQLTEEFISGTALPVIEPNLLDVSVDLLPTM